MLRKIKGYEILLLLIIPMWMGLANHWYSWYGKEDNLVWIKSIYKLLDGNKWANFSMCLIVFYLAYLSYCKIWKDNDIRPYRLALTIIGLLLLWWESNVVYAQTGFGIDYRILLTIILSILLLTMVIKLYKQVAICNKSGEKEEENTKDKFDIPEKTKNYASHIGNEILSKDIYKTSFAIGIAGEWGSGKTTFLQLIKESIKGKAYVVDFNPWMCKMPEQVTQDFFSSLREQLSPLHSTLSKSIKEYSNLLSDLTVPTLSTFGINAKLLVKEESLQEKKKSLSEKFSCLPKPVVVFIDDIDRLEKDEVFEVLRLIRNTADLSNTVYAVAYDKEYVVNILEEGKIKNASSYLEKIFPLEVNLPKTEDYIIEDALKRNIKQLYKSEESFEEDLFEILKEDQRKLLLRVLNNFRGAERFAETFILNHKFLENESSPEIEILDLLWLELLKQYDIRVYNKLAKDPIFLLDVDYDNKTYKLNKKKCEKETSCKKETPNILEQIFGEDIKRIEQSISYIENYEKYFTLGISKHKVSTKEMNELLNNDKPEEIIVKWKNKYLSSIKFQIEQVNVSMLNEKQLKNLLCGALLFEMKTGQLGKNLPKLLEKKKYNNKINKVAHDTVISWIEDNLSGGNKLSNKEHVNLSILLNWLYLYEEKANNIDYNYIVNNDEIKTYLIKNIEKFLRKNSGITAVDIVKENKTLFHIFRNCCVNTETTYYIGDEGELEDEHYVYEQFAFDTVIDFFSKNKDKPTLKEFEQAYDKTFNPEKHPQYNVPQMRNDISEFYKRDIEKHFGSNPDERINEFKQKCFINTEEKDSTEEETTADN